MRRGHGPVSKIVGGAIGIGQEAYAHHKQSKEKQGETAKAQGARPPPEEAQSPHDEPGDEYPPAYDGDHEQWELDDAQHEEMKSDEDEDLRDTDKLIQRFFKNHPPTQQVIEHGDLELPVIIPQRRPSHKTRGFVRAYAPELQTVGIDERTFIEFIDGIGNAIKYHQTFNVIQLGVLAAAITVEVLAGPSITIHLAAFAVHTSIEMSRRGYVNTQTNKYLDAMNENYFKPHGLYAMVITYKEGATDPIATIDASSNIVHAVGARAGTDPEHEKHHSFKDNLKSSSGKTQELLIPESAELIYPALDALPDDKKSNKMKRGMNFLSDYFDRRAQATWEADHPESRLNSVQDPENKGFAGKFADPTSDVNKGGILNLATGGAMAKRSDQDGGGRGGLLGRGSGGLLGRERGGLLSRGRGAGGRGGAQGGRKKKGGLKKMLKENVIYLMVVNMPTEAELKEVEEMIQRAKADGKKIY